MVADGLQEIRDAEQQMLATLNQLRAMRGEPPLSEFPMPPYCSFCGRSKSEMGALVSGLNAYICIECAGEARNLLLRGK